MIDATALLACAREAVAYYGGTEDDAAAVCERVLGQPTAPRNLRAYCYSAARHAIVDRKRREAHERVGMEALRARDGAITASPPDGDWRPALEALDGLSVRFQRVLEARALGLSYQEIAAALGVPIGTVMSRLHYARAALRRAMGEEEG